MIVSWYAIDFIRYSDFDEKKQIENVNGDILVLMKLKIMPDASYMPIKAKSTDKTQITGIGIKSLFINNIEDLQKGQKVRVWYSPNSENEKITKKVVVYNLF
jgi:hypothetical protein